jgi:hypothetical protein
VDLGGRPLFVIITKKTFGDGFKVSIAVGNGVFEPRRVFVIIAHMAELKTTVNDASVEDFINNVTDETKRQDSFALLEMFSRITSEKPKMWGSSIIGFGKYHYKSERSSQEGDWPLTGFSPRKQSLTLYFMPGFDDYRALLKDLGKHKTSVGCLYIKRLADVDMRVLEKLVKQSYLEFKKKNS